MVPSEPHPGIQQGALGSPNREGWLVQVDPADPASVNIGSPGNGRLRTCRTAEHHQPPAPFALWLVDHFRARRHPPGVGSLFAWNRRGRSLDDKGLGISHCQNLRGALPQDTLFAFYKPKWVMVRGHPLVRKKRQGKKEPVPKDRRSLGELAIARWREFLNRIVRLSIVVRFLGSRPRKPFSHPSGSSARVLASPWDAHSPVRGRFPLLQAPTPAFCRSHKALCSFPGPFRLLEKWFTGTGPVPSLPLAQGKVG